MEAMNEGQANEQIQYLLQGDNEVFMINPQEEDGLQADGHEHNEHIEQLNQPNPAPLPLAPAYWVVEEVPVDQLIDPMITIQIREQTLTFSSCRSSRILNSWSLTIRGKMSSIYL
jgi:hypothetical protein